MKIIKNILRYLRTILFLPIILPVVIVILAIRPFIIIRFKRLPAERIGHYATETDLYLCESEAGIHGPRVVDIFYQNTKDVCNKQLCKMWTRSKLNLFPSWWSMQLLQVFPLIFSKIPGGKKCIIPKTLMDTHGLLNRTPSYLSFTPEEEKFGYKELERLGIPAGEPFLCFHARDPAYLSSRYLQSDQSYHNYRNANITNYLPAVEKLTNRGYYAVRMGSVVEKKLATENSKILDYANNGRTDFMDIFLSAKCKFFLCSTGGINSVPRIFRRPVINANSPLRVYMEPTIPYYVIFKKLWLHKEKRFMTFREAFELYDDDYRGDYSEYGIEFVENTPDEITDIAIEVDERLNVTWNSSKEDEELQKLFWSTFEKHHPHRYRFSGPTLARVGAAYLRQNRNLLG